MSVREVIVIGSGPAGLTWALNRALDVWGSGTGSDRERWTELQRNGMQVPFGWQHRIGEYLDLYRELAPAAAQA